MSQPIGMVVFVVIAAVVAVVLIMSNRQRDRLLDDLAALSAQKGWQLARKPSAYVDALIRGTDGDIPWQMEWTNSQRPRASQRTYAESVEWSAAVPSSLPGSVILYPRLPNMPPAAALGSMGTMSTSLLQTFLQAAGIDLSVGPIQPAGSTAFQERYIAMAPDLETAQRVASEVEMQLLQWPEVISPVNLPFVTVSPSGVSIRMARTSTSPAIQLRAAELLVPLGVAAVEAAR